MTNTVREPIDEEKIPNSMFGKARLLALLTFALGVLKLAGWLEDHRWIGHAVQVTVSVLTLAALVWVMAR